jgi:Holliday junction resolvase
MGLKQYKSGKKFEEELCWWFRKNGYYPEYHEKSANGSQNGDITAIKDNIAYKIECKNLENSTGRFPLSRIEMNQTLSYKAFKECGNSNFILAIRWGDNVYFVDFGLVQFYDKSIPLKDLNPTITNWNKFVDELNNK